MSAVATTIASTRLIIGMEIHVELATRSKMFTRAANGAHPDHYDAAPNTLVDPLVAALPGSLPMMNRQAIEMSIMVGLALNCSISPLSKWDRKNYFYPDLPKGYQISQYDLPLCAGGWLEIPTGADGEAMKRIRITRAHLEEDAGKLGHELPGGNRYDGSLIDLNRAGTPLLEIVSEPDMASADEAVMYGRELRNICRFLGVSEGIMQRGHMRFEPNINVCIQTEDGREFFTPIVEIKNLNSFRALRSAIEFEHTRQVEAWEEKGVTQASGNKTTRGWDDAREVTVLQRGKEEAHDYRYFPDPDLVPVIISDAWRERVAERVPELPMQRRARFVDEYGLAAKDAATLTEERDVCLFFEGVLIASAKQTPESAQSVAKLLLNIGAKRANEQDCLISDLGVSPGQVAQIIELRDADTIGSSAADTLFGLLCETDGDAAAVAERHQLIQVSDDSKLDEWMTTAIANQPQAAEDFAAGKDAAAGRLIGEIMKLSGGQADAKAVNTKLRERLRG